MTARKKLQRTLEVEHKRFTTSALQEMALKIRALVTRKHEDEASLLKRKITPYDKVLANSKSKKIIKLQALLKKG